MILGLRSSNRPVGLQHDRGNNRGSSAEGGLTIAEGHSMKRRNRLKDQLYTWIVGGLMLAVAAGFLWFVAWSMDQPVTTAMDPTARSATVAARPSPDYAATDAARAATEAVRSAAPAVARSTMTDEEYERGHTDYLNEQAQDEMDRWDHEDAPPGEDICGPGRYSYEC